MGIDRKTLVGQPDGGLHDVGQRHGAVALLHVHQAGDQTGNGHGQRPGAAQVGHGLSVADEHVAAGAQRSAFPEIDRHAVAPFRQIQQQEPAATDPGRLRPQHADGERGGDRGVDRVAPAAQHLGAGLAGRGVGRGDHAVSGRRDEGRGFVRTTGRSNEQNRNESEPSGNGSLAGGEFHLGNPCWEIGFKPMPHAPRLSIPRLFLLAGVGATHASPLLRLRWKKYRLASSSSGNASD